MKGHVTSLERAMALAVGHPGDGGASVVPSPTSCRVSLLLYRVYWGSVGVILGYRPLRQP